MRSAWRWAIGAVALLPSGLVGAIECDVLTTDCSTIASKLPVVTRTVANPGTAVTANLDPDARRAFEHLMGQALRETDAVAWVTRAFARRMRAFIVGGAALNGTSSAAALSAAFITSECGPANTGYVGPFLPAIESVLSGEGNIREVWALMYVLTKTHFFTSLMHALLSPSPKGGAAKASPAELQARFGMSASTVADRWQLVQDTAKMRPSALRYAQGAPDFEFEALSSWVRFDFSSQKHDGSLQWRGARVSKPGGCTTEKRQSDDPSIQPPLSKAELAYQCARAPQPRSVATPPPCTLQWQPGMLCFTLPNISWTLSDGSTVAGLSERAALLGYRSAAAASGTTANMLQMAELLGFSSDERVLLRLAMAGWMMPTDDHSFFEIMLGAEAYVPPAYRMAMGLEDLGQLWPPNATLATADGKQTFHASDLWTGVGKKLDAPEGRVLAEAMAPKARAYVRQLIASASGGARGGLADE